MTFIATTVWSYHRTNQTTCAFELLATKLGPEDNTIIPAGTDTQVESSRQQLDVVYFYVS